MIWDKYTCNKLKSIVKEEMGKQRLKSPQTETHLRRISCKKLRIWTLIPSKLSMRKYPLECFYVPLNLLSNRQIWPWSIEWSRAKANSVLPKERTDHNKRPLPTTQEKTLHMDITRWSTPKSDWFYSLQQEMLYTVSKNKTGSWLWLRSWTPYCQIQTENEESRENH